MRIDDPETASWITALSIIAFVAGMWLLVGSVLGVAFADIWIIYPPHDGLIAFFLGALLAGPASVWLILPIVRQGRMTTKQIVATVIIGLITVLVVWPVCSGWWERQV